MRSIFIILSLFVVSYTIAENPAYRLYIQTGLALTFNDKFEESKEMFLRVINTFPNDPAGYFFFGVAMQSEMMAHEDWEATDSLKSIFERAVELAEKEPRNPWALYIKGSSLGYLAILEIRDGEYISALPYIRGAVNSLLSAIKIEPYMYDAYLGLGGYYYWKSKKLGFLNNLLFLEDDRAKGIQYLRLASEKSVFSRDPAKHALLVVLVEEKRFNEAYALAEYLEKKYPGSTLPLWDKLLIAEGEKNLADIMSITERLLARLRAEENSNNYNMIEVLHKRALAADRLNWDSEVLEASKEALSLELSEEIRNKQAGKLRELRALRSRALKGTNKQQIPSEK